MWDMPGRRHWISSELSLTPSVWFCWFRCLNQSLRGLLYQLWVTHCVAQKSSIGARGGWDKSLSPTYVQIRPVSTRLREPPNGSNFTFKLAVSCTIARSNVNVIHDLGVSIFDRETTSSLERSSECSLCSWDEHCSTFGMPWNLPNAC